MRWALAIVLLCAVIGAVVGAAQFRGGRGRQTYGRVSFASRDDFDGGFQFCRLVFRNDRNGDGAGWNVDWPRADENLSIRLSELTRVPVSMDTEQTPKHLLLRATDEALSHCGFIMMTEPGGAYFDDEEARSLRTYLAKGGFLWADDFWGDYAFEFWTAQIRKVLPAATFPIVDLPLDHPFFHEVLPVTSIPQIPSIDFWRGRRSTSERGAESAVPHVRAINDDRGRVMVLMTHNTDFGDAYERESEDREYFVRFSVPGYAFGVNVVVYAMTH